MKSRWLLGICLLALACEQTQGGPVPREVIPGRGRNDRATAITVRGESFNPAIRASYDDENKSTVDARFAVEVGEHILIDVLWVGPTEITATVPAGLPPGIYDLRVRDPRGGAGVLARSFEVVDAGGASDGGGVDGAADGGAGDGPQPDAVADGPLRDTRADFFVPDSLTVDLVTLPDLGNCPPSCINDCSGGYCELDCTSGCTCPAGIPCRTSCDDTGCTGTIDCRAATSCVVTCTSNDSGCRGNLNCPNHGDCTVRAFGPDAFDGNIECGDGNCRVICLDFSQRACRGDVDCSASCACMVVGFQGNVECPSACNQGCGLFDGCDNC